LRLIIDIITLEAYYMFVSLNNTIF